jgi:beta-fructofuranosidase
MFEPHRPAYHLTPPKGWMNDPNGPLYHKGRYHIFYQHNPAGDFWGTIHWGHARSKDLLHWEHLPVALAPSPCLGEIHCFSGCAVLDGGTPSILYTSVGEGPRNARDGAEQWLARGDDSLTAWKKYPAPILTVGIHRPAEKDRQILEWRDPFVWKENGAWQLLLGGSRNGYGCILLYQSADLIHWRYVNTFFEDQNYPFLECPNLLRFGGRSVLIYSPGDAVRYHVGFVNREGRFVPEKSGVLDYSGRGGFYAPNTLLNDPVGRYITWGWITEQSRNGYPIQGYNGALSLPRILSLNTEGNLIQTPAEEVSGLRIEPAEHIELSLSGGEQELKTRGMEAEIRLTLFPQGHDDFYLNIYKSKDGRECTRIHYNADKGELTLEKGLSSLAAEPAKDFQRAKIPAVCSGLDLRVFLDRSIIEIFANNETVITGRVYPVLEDSTGISVSGKIGRATITIWRIRL